MRMRGAARDGAGSRSSRRRGPGPTSSPWEPRERRREVGPGPASGCLWPRRRPNGTFSSPSSVRSLPLKWVEVKCVFTIFLTLLVLQLFVIYSAVAWKIAYFHGWGILSTVQYYLGKDTHLPRLIIFKNSPSWEDKKEWTKEKGEGDA